MILAGGVVEPNGNISFDRDCVSNLAQTSTATQHSPTSTSYSMVTNIVLVLISDKTKRT